MTIGLRVFVNSIRVGLLFTSLVAAVSLAGDVPRNFSATDNQPLESTTPLVKSGAGTLWLTQTAASGFSGDIIVEKDGGTLQLGGNTAESGGVAFPAMGAVNTITLEPGTTLLINDNASGNANGYVANRLGGMAGYPALVLRGGALTVTGPNANTASEQSLGALTLPSGVAVITVTRSHASATPSLVAESLAISSGAYLAFAGTSLGGAASGASQIRFNTPPTTIGGGGGDGTTTVSIIPAARLGNDFVTYGAYGVRALTASEYYATADINGAAAADNVRFNNASLIALADDTGVNSLVVSTAATWNMGAGKRLTLTSGQLLTSVNVTLAQGVLTAGDGNAADLNIVPTANTLIISAAVTDNGAGKVRLVKSGGGTLSLRTANSYSGGTVVNEGTLSTVGTAAGTTFFGSGPVLVDNAALTLTAIGSTANNDGADYTAVNGGQISMAALAYTEDDTFAVGPDSVIYGTAVALNSLERGVNVTLAAEAVVAHAALAVPLDLNSHTINNLGTAADLYYGLSANQDNANAIVTIGNGSPFKGVSTDRSNRAWRQGTIDVAFGTSDIWLQGLATPGNNPAILYLGNTPVTAGAPIINLNGNGAVTAHVVGNVQLYDSDAIYGNVANGENLTFAVEPGATLTAAYGNCMGSGDGVAAIVVKAGGTLETASTLANRGWEAFNGDVTIEAGGRLTVNAPGGLSGSGQLTLKSGAILEISGATGFSGPQAAAAIIEPGVIVRLNVATFDSTSDQLYDYFEEAGAIFELYRSASGAAVPATAGSTVLRLNRGDGADKRLVGGLDDGTFSAVAGGLIEVGPAGGVIAATSGKTLTVSTPVAIGANELIIGDTNSYDGVSEPKLGTVTLGAGVDYSTADLGGRITVLPGAELRNTANSLPDLVAVDVAGSFYAAAADTVGSISGTGVVTVAADISVGANDAATVFNGILDGSKKLTKVGSGRLDLTGGESPFSGTVNVGGGELALSSGGRLGQTGTAAFTLTSGGTLHLDNSEVNLDDRLSGAAPGITFQGGTLLFTGKDGAGSSEELGAAAFSGGASTIELYNGSGTGSSADLLFSSLTANPAGTVNFVVHNGTLGESGDNPRVRFNGLAEGVIGNGSVGNIPAWYDTTYGVRAFTLGEGTEFDGTVLQNAIDTVFTTANVNPTITVAKHTVRSIWIDSPGTGKFIDLSTNGNYSLTIASGHLTLTGNDDFEIKRSTGTGTFTWSPNYLSLNIVEPTTTLTLSAPTTKAISKNGPGTLLVNSDHTGALVINEGLVKYGPDGDFGAINLTTYGDGFLDLAGKGDETLAALTLYAGGVTNSGSEVASTLIITTLTMGAGSAGTSALVALASGDTLKLGGTVTYNIANNPGTAFISGGTLDLNGATRTFTINDSPSAAIDLDVSSVLTGNADNGLIKGGAGVLRLSGANTFDGPVTVGGILRLAHPQALGLPSTAHKLTVNSGATVALDPANGTINIAPPRTVSLSGVGSAVIGPVSGALVNLDGANEVSSAVTLAAASHIASLAGTLTISGTIGGNYALTINGDGDTALTGVRSGTSTVVKNGAGTLTLAAANTYSGATTINAGVVSARHNNAFGTTDGGVTVNAGGELQLQDSVAIGAEALTIGGSGVNGGGALRNISGTNTYGGKVTIGQDAARIGSDSGLLTLDVASGNALDGSNLDVVFGGAGDITVADPIATSAGGVTKEGSGILTLAAANTYTGPTTLKAGRLNLSGSTAAGSAVTVAGGATLGGIGSALGKVTIEAGGLLAPGVGGTAGGVLTAGSLNAASDSSLLFELSAAPANDKLVVSADNGLVLGANIGIYLYRVGTEDAWDGTGIYNLIQYSGTFDGGLGGLRIANPHPDLCHTIFVEDNWIKVRVEPIKVSALAVTDVTPASARLNGEVVQAAADDPEVWFCLDYEDKGTAATSSWGRVEHVGKYGAGQAFAKVFSGLHTGSNYTYRVFAENSVGSTWSAAAISFTTIYLPTIVNHGAAGLSPGTMRLQGEVLDIGCETPIVRFHYWIDGDAATNVVNVGLQDSLCDIDITDLQLGADFSYFITAENQAGTATSAIMSFRGSAVIHVSPAGNDAASGLNWEEAKQTVAAAVVMSDDGDLILVTNGIYTVSEPLLIDRAVAMQSVNGAAHTIITRDLAYEIRLLILSNELAEVVGLCFSNGAGRAYEGQPNQSSFGGGARIFNGAVRDSLFVDNLCMPAIPGVTTGSTRLGYGGGLYMDDGRIENCIFINNIAKGEGGSSSGQGGGFVMVDGYAINCIITNNSTAGTGNGRAHGGGLSITGQGQLLSCVVADNSARGAGNQSYTYGGGIYMTGDGVVSNCYITGNEGTYSTPSGGGLRADAGLVTHCLIASNTITSTSNTSASYGGGAYMGGTAILRNSLVFDNRAINTAQLHKESTFGGGVSIWNSARVEYCTIVRNARDVFGYGDGVHITGGELVNSIVAHNYEGYGTLPYSLNHENVWQTGGSVRHCVVPRSDISNGEANITSDPGLSNLLAYDFHPGSGSPAIGAALALPFVDNDYEGTTRSLTAPDIGALESLPDGAGTLRVNFTASQEEGFDSLAVTLTAHVAGAHLNGLTYVWDIDGDGVDDIIGPDKSVVVTDFTSAGYYTIRLTVANSAAETAQCLKPDFIRLYPSKLYVNHSGSAEPPFDTPEKGSPIIADVVPFAENGSSIYVAKGIYGISDAAVLVHRAIKIIGRGPTESIIERQGTGNTRLFLMSDPGAVLSGLTLRGGTWKTAGLAYGAAVWLLDGMIDRCIITNNVMQANPNAAGYGGGVSMDGGVLRNSLITMNRVHSSNSSANGGGVYMTGGRIEHCTIVSNRASRTTESQSDVSNTKGGGVRMTGGTIVNSIIYHNTIGYEGPEDPDISTALATPDITFSCSPSLEHDPDGSGNINGAPGFIDSAAGDWRLHDDAPCVNVATYLDWSAGGTDLLGLPRVGRGAPDLGCYEIPTPRGTILMLR